MIEINRSKAKHFKDQFVLSTVLENVNQHPSNKDVFGRYGDSSGTLEVRTRYINESKHDISIILANGATWDIPATNTTSNRLVVCLTVQWGDMCQFNLKALQSQMPDLTPTMELDIVNAITNQALEHKTKVLTFYYYVDISNIDRDPYGIWIEAVNSQVVCRTRAHTTTFFTRDAFYNPIEDVDDMAEIIYTTAMSFTYFNPSSDLGEPVFIPVGNDAVEVKQIYHPGMRKGLYINLTGEASFVASKTNKRFLYIAPEDFLDYGIYNSYREFIEIVGSAKTGDRKHMERLLKTFKRYHRSLGDEDEDYLKIKEIRILGDLTIGGFTELLNEAGKLDALLSKLFKK